MDDLPITSFVRVGRLEELKARGRLVVRGPHRPILVSAKRRGRPVTTGTGTTIGVRMLDDRIAVLDAWIAKQKPTPSRPEAVRRLVELGLTVKTHAKPTGKTGRPPNWRPNRSRV
jgi:hypothetical protein